MNDWQWSMLIFTLALIFGALLRIGSDLHDIAHVAQLMLAAGGH